MSTLKHILAALSCLATTIGASLVDNGTTITLGGTPYYAAGVPVAKLNIGPSYVAAGYDADLLPMTVIHTNQTTFNGAHFNTSVMKFLADDDVFQEGFLSSVFLHYDGVGRFQADVASVPRGLTIMATATNNTGILRATLSKNLPNGPYFVSARTGAVCKAYRLYDDEYLSLIQGVISDEKDGFLSLPAVVDGVMTKSFAVPSRLYYTVTPEKPLAGLRFGVKDIYHVKGVRTSGGNRAYYYTYGPQNATAPAVQRMIDQGAVLVGKLGTVQFANGDNPTADWVDLHCPFNPRADGYQNPGGSSTGPAVAVAAYPWLDVALGTDTGGSCRTPAALNGLYGNRPSIGAVSMDGVIPLTPVLDTAGVIAKSAALWARVVRNWYTNVTAVKDKGRGLPRKLFYSPVSAHASYLDKATPEAKQLVESFVQKLERFMQTNRTIANVTAQWTASRPSGAPANVSEMLSNTYGVLTAVDQYNILAKQLYADYAIQNEGRRPYINPGPLARWKWGQERNSSYTSAVQNTTLFRNWWETSGYGRHDPHTCTEGVFVYAYRLGAPDYRDRYLEPPTAPPSGFENWAVAGFASASEVVVPVGEVKYESRVSGKEEWLPVSVAMMVASGCEWVLADLVEGLAKEAILRESKTGRRI